MTLPQNHSTKYKHQTDSTDIAHFVDDAIYFVFVYAPLVYKHRLTVAILRETATTIEGVIVKSADSSVLSKEWSITKTYLSAGLSRLYELSKTFNG